MEMTKNPRTAASAWAPELIAIAPSMSLHGSALPFAGYPTTGTPAAAAQHTGTTLAAVRKDDARVPEPRGRQR